jgi:hypothetical protein
MEEGMVNELERELPGSCRKPVRMLNLMTFGVGTILASREIDLIAVLKIIPEANLSKKVLGGRHEYDI